MVEPVGTFERGALSDGVRIKTEDGLHPNLRAPTHPAPMAHLPLYNLAAPRCTAPPSSLLPTAPGITPQLLDHLPSLKALDPLQLILRLHPSGINFDSFRRRVKTMKEWFQPPPLSSAPRSIGLESMAQGMHVQESDAFPRNGVAEKDREFPETEDTLEQPAQREEPTMSLYAAAAAAYALAGLVGRSTGEEEEPEEDGGRYSSASDTWTHLDVEAFLSGAIGGGKRAPSSKTTSNHTFGPPASSSDLFPSSYTSPPRLSPTQLHWLAVNALTVYEMSVSNSGGMYDLDYLVAGVFGVLWGLYGGGTNKTGGSANRSVGGRVYAEASS
jgi:hypothetical protein